MGRSFAKGLARFPGFAFTAAIRTVSLPVSAILILKEIRGQSNAGTGRY